MFFEESFENFIHKLHFSYIIFLFNFLMKYCWLTMLCFKYTAKWLSYTYIHFFSDSFPLWKWSHSVVSDSLWPHGLKPTRLLGTWDSPGKNTRVCCHFLLQGIFPTQGLNPLFLLGRWNLYHWATWEAVDLLQRPKSCDLKYPKAETLFYSPIEEFLHIVDTQQTVDGTRISVEKLKHWIY